MTFCLIVLGATVTSKGVGLAAPDWPTTFGYNMFLFPPSMWVGGLFWEHLHRLFGSTVGLISIGVVLSMWRVRRERRNVWRLSVAVLLLVIVQGVMGGLRVTEMSTFLAILHGVTGQIVLCTMVVLAAATGRFWTGLASQSSNHAKSRLFGRPMHLVSYAVLATLLAQVMLGAAMRHTGSGLAIPDFPSSYGGIVPPLTQEGITASIDGLPYDQHVSYFSVAQVAVHFAHRVGAVAVLIVMAGWLGLILRKSPQHPMLTGPVTAVVALLLAQLMLGALVIWTGRHPEIATAHTALGAVLMGTTTLLTVRVHLAGQQASTDRAIIESHDPRTQFPAEVVA